MHRIVEMITRGAWSVRVTGIAGLVLACILSASPAFAQETTFRFNPPNGATFIETSTMTVTREISSAGKEQVVDETKTRIVFKKSGTGFIGTFTPLSATRSVNGKQASSANAADFKNATLTYTLDATGKVTGITGFSAILKDMVAKLPAEQAKKINLAAEEKKMVDARKKEWDAQITRFSGKKVKTGEAWTTTDTIPLPGKQTVPAKKVTKFFFPVKVNGHDCVKLVSSFTPDAAALKAAMNRSFAGASSAPPRVLGVTVTMTGERIMDPSTMLIYSEITVNTTKITVDIPKKGQQTITTIEKKEQKIDYKG